MTGTDAVSKGQRVDSNEFEKEFVEICILKLLLVDYYSSVHA